MFIRMLSIILAYNLLVKIGRLFLRRHVCLYRLFDTELSQEHVHWQCHSSCVTNCIFRQLTEISFLLFISGWVSRKSFIIGILKSYPYTIHTIQAYNTRWFCCFHLKCSNRKTWYSFLFELCKLAWLIYHKFESSGEKQHLVWLKPYRVVSTMSD